MIQTVLSFTNSTPVGLSSEISTWLYKNQAIVVKDIKYLESAKGYVAFIHYEHR